MTATPTVPLTATLEDWARALVANRLDALAAAVRAAPPADRERAAVGALREVEELAGLVVAVRSPEALDPRAAVVSLAAAAWPEETCQDTGRGELPAPALRLVEARLGPPPGPALPGELGDVGGCVDCADGLPAGDGGGSRDTGPEGG